MTERREINFSIDVPETVEQYDDVLSAWLAFRGPLPEPREIHFTIRQRIRIWRTRRRERIEQWIHDHLNHAHCDY